MVDRGSKYLIRIMQMVVRYEMELSNLKDDTVHAIYGGLEEVFRVCSMGEAVVGI